METAGGYPAATMPSERVQRQIDFFLDQAEAALREQQWDQARDFAERVLVIDADSEDAKSFLAMAGGAPIVARPSVSPPPTSVAALFAATHPSRRSSATAMFRRLR